MSSSLLVMRRRPLDCNRKYSKIRPTAKAKSLLFTFSLVGCEFKVGEQPEECKRVVSKSAGASTRVSTIVHERSAGSLEPIMTR